MTWLQVMVDEGVHSPEAIWYKDAMAFLEESMPDVEVKSFWDKMREAFGR